MHTLVHRDPPPFANKKHMEFYRSSSRSYTQRLKVMVLALSPLTIRGDHMYT